MNNEHLNSSNSASSCLPIDIKMERLSPSHKEDSFGIYEYDEETDVEDFAEESTEDCKRELNLLSSLQWFKIVKTQNYPRDFPFIENGIGPKNIPLELKSPDEYFNLFIDSAFLSKLAADTNAAYDAYKKYFPLVESISISEISISLHQWIPTNPSEIKVFLVLILACALINKAKLTDFWDNNWLFATPNFAKVMSRDRFLLLLKFLYYKDDLNTEIENIDCVAPDIVEPIIDVFNAKFSYFYVPDQDIYIKDSLISAKERIQFIKHLSTNYCRDYGIRLWQLRDSTTDYCCKLCFSVGLRNEIEHSLSHKILFKLMYGHLDKGHHLYTNSFCSSNELCNLLFKRYTYTTGVTCLRNSELPSQLRQVKATSLSEKVQYFRQAKILVTNFDDGLHEDVRLVSTVAKVVDVCAITQTGYEISVPDIIHSFHTGMGEHNYHNQLTWYLNNKMGISTWKRIFFNILCCVLQNSYVLYMSMNRNKIEVPFLSNSFYMEVITNVINQYLSNTSASNENHIPTVFTCRSVDSLVEVESDESEMESISGIELESFENCATPSKSGEQPSKKARSQSPVEHVLEALPSPKNCSMCLLQDIRKKTKFYCSTCIVGLCIGECFINYHKIHKQ